jgi:S1-C subfamily serine protease
MAVMGYMRHSWWLAAVAAVALTAAASAAPPASRWSTLNMVKGGTAPAAGSEPAAGCYTATRSGVVTLKFSVSGSGAWQGTGFLIGSKGVVVTNYHLIEGATEGEAALGAESRKIEGVLGYDKVEDLALVKMDVAGLEFSALSLTASVAAAKTTVTAVGGAWRFADAINEGEIIAAESGDELKKSSPELAGSGALGAAAEWLVVTAPVSPGNSGGPLVGPEGTVAGVLVWSRATAGKVNRAAPVSALRRLMAGAAVEASPLGTIAAREAAAKPSVDDPAAGEFESGWEGCRRYSRSEVSETIVRAGRAAECPRCKGTGTITVTRFVPFRSRGMIEQNEVKETQRCPDCQGAGVKWGDQTGPLLARLVQEVMLADRRGPAADYGRMASAGAEAFRAAALDSRQDGRKANESLERAPANLRSARGTPAVFYATVAAVVPYGAGELYAVRTSSGNQTIIVQAGGRLAEGRAYLVGGIWAGTVTIPVEGGAACVPGVEALWAEQLH